MKDLIRNIRLALIIPLMWLVVLVTPKDATKTLKWITKMPVED